MRFQLLDLPSSAPPSPLFVTGVARIGIRVDVVKETIIKCVTAVEKATEKLDKGVTDFVVPLTEFSPSMAISARRDVCPIIKNILLLDSEGRRVAVKYYTDEWPTNSDKLAFESSSLVKH
ncbi:hypothetical protein L2E82_09157 [Cichorium intybus]|uniref:Uncharacterized protein n=1 Tax=Cichorium intybus TaxID=13427 RepID=A0ACB9G7K6_CICIN|nr:hypothetical protein L2E82_09157 [Cichorium intybus]